jgi:dihydrodipicolinate synthase/N-acetylneuraminate lyase
MATKHELTGLFVPNITPTLPNGQLDEGSLREYVEWLIGKGIHGLYPNGSTGEFLRFTASERRRVIEVVVDQVRDRIPILAGAAEANVAETIDACNYYGDLGVRAVAIVSPYYYRLSSDGVYAFFKSIADQVRVDVTLYNIPMFASPIDLETISRLAMDCPRVVGIKDSSGDLPFMMRMISSIRPQRPDFRFLTGWDASLAPMLMAGCDGGTNATSGAIPELTLAIYAAVQAGDTKLAMDLQYKLLPIFDAMIGVAEFPEGFRRGVAVRGVKLGESRQPVSEASIRAADEAQSKLADLFKETLKSL